MPRVFTVLVRAYCQRCGRRDEASCVEALDRLGWRKFKEEPLLGSRVVYPEGEASSDLCPTCSAELTAWLKSGRSAGKDQA